MLVSRWVLSLLAALAVTVLLIDPDSGSAIRAAHDRTRVVAAAHASGSPGTQAGRSTAAPNRHGVAAGGRRPNIVFVLTDDLSMDLVRYMPQVQALETRGLTFNDYFVSDSLCCPSRASIFTGEYPHDTGVFTNTGADGGIGAFFANGDQQRTFNIALQHAGYRTAMMGKYLNGYLAGPTRSPLPPNYVPAGWNVWDVAGWGYNEFNYPMNVNGTVKYFGHRPRDYLTDVIARKGVQFINGSARSHTPFFLELATFAPHTPYTPAPRDAHDFPGLKAPEPANFDTLPINPPAWLANHPPLRPGQIARIDRAFRRRVQAVQAVDDMIARIEAALVAHHMLSNTYIVFSSDNGLHTGEYRLMPGKLTAFDTDIHVPLVVAGPGVAPDSTTNAMSENIDLAETFSRLGGTSLQGDGHTLTPLFGGLTPAGWRNAVLIEHHGPAQAPNDPDAQTRLSGNPPTYEALRTPTLLYVEYADGELELYNLVRDPFELDNIAPSTPPAELASLHTALDALRRCHGGSACWAAEHVSAGP